VASSRAYIASKVPAGLTQACEGFVDEKVDWYAFDDWLPCGGAGDRGW